MEDLDLQDRNRIEEMIRDAGGATVLFDGARTWAIRGVTDEELFSRLQVQAADHTIQVATGTIDPPQGATVHVEGVPYKVREPPQRIDDGKMTMIGLEEA